MDTTTTLAATTSARFRPLWHDERFYVLDGPPSPVEAAVPLSFERYTAWSEELETAIRTIRESAANLEPRFARGHSCFILRHDGAPVGCGWASVGEWGGDGPARPLTTDAAFVYDGFTRADYRGKRIAPARQAHVANTLRAQGCVRICTTIRDDNVASQKAALRAGYRRTEHLVRVYRMRIMSWLQSGGPPPEFLPH